MIGAILLLGNITFFGLVTSYFFGLKLYLEERVAAAGLIGLIGLGYIGFFISHFWGLSRGNLILFLLIINILILAQLRKSLIQEIILETKNLIERYQKRGWQIFGGLLILLCMIFGFLASQLLIYKDGSYYVQPVHAYGDISLHLGLISSFVYGNNFPAQNPNFAGTTISYPFMVDFISAFFVSPIGLDVSQSVALTGSVLFGILIVLAVFFILHLTGSKKTAIVGLIIFLCSGGLGFIYLYGDWVLSGKKLFELLLALPKDYTAMKDTGYWWINVNLSMLLPQRSFLLGFPVSLLILTTLLNLVDKFQLKTFLLTVVLLALLPLMHAHSLLALVPFVLFLTLVIFKKEKQHRLLITLVGLNGLVAAYLLSKIFLVQSDGLVNLFHWQLGWMSGQESILRFYVKNFGLILFILPLGLYFVRKNTKLFQLGLISLVWFFLPSMIIFQPWDFDNIKLFIYWYFFAAIISGLFLIRIFSFNWITKGVVSLVLLVMILSGGLDIWRLLVGRGTQYSIYSPEQIKLAEFVKNNTPEKAVFVSEDKFDNPVVSLAGRKVVMGFSAWLWTYGLDFSSRQQVVTRILNGTATPEDFKKYRVTHVLFFPNEAHYVQNQTYFDAHAKLIYQENGYRLYQL